ncbi:MAG: methyltransferase domain-containing protein [Candidatus Woesebacteria bacterium]|jgi:SAM-dependent methyltransferase
MALINEEILEPLARTLRFREGTKYIYKNKPLTIADLGCGPRAPYLNFLKRKKIKIKKYVGIDPLVKFDSKDQTGSGLKLSVKKTLPFKSNTFDYVVAFAFLEHIDHPKNVIGESLRILNTRGKLIITTPTPKAKRLLEFLSYSLKLLSRREIEEHKNYFNKESLLKLLPKKNLKVIHKYFEFGLKLNKLLVVEKLK